MVILNDHLIAVKLWRRRGGPARRDCGAQDGSSIRTMTSGPSRPIALLVLAAWTLVLCCARTPHSVRALPERIDDSMFWQMLTTFSEPNGSFPSDDVVSNESAFQHVLPLVETADRRHSAYVGVGPEQNFTYIAAIAPGIAFIVDIRRANMLLHLMYKALIELSTTRADFVSKLFARPMRAADESGTVDALFDGIAGVPADARLYATTRAAIHARLARRAPISTVPRGLGNTGLSVQRVHNAGAGSPDYSIGRGSESVAFPSYRELMLATDAQGRQGSYLASDEQYERLRQMELRNLIVPIVGDFGGPKALRSVAAWLRERDALVGTFYTSNVEQYLFGGDDWQRFYASAGALPIDATSVFVRAVIDVRPVPPASPSHPVPLRTVMMTSPIADTVSAVRSGRIRHYRDVVDLSKAEPLLR